jgi:hypothetical protein
MNRIFTAAALGLFMTLVIACGGQSIHHDAVGNPTGEIDPVVPSQPPIVSEVPSANAGRGGSSATGGKGGTGNAGNSGAGEAPVAGKGGSAQAGTGGTGGEGSMVLTPVITTPTNDEILTHFPRTLDVAWIGNAERHEVEIICGTCWPVVGIDQSIARIETDDFANSVTVELTGDDYMHVRVRAILGEGEYGPWSNEVGFQFDTSRVNEEGSVTVSLAVGDLPGRDICVTDDDESTLQFDLTTEGDVPPVTGVTLHRVGSGSTADVKTLSVEIDDAFISDKIEVLGDTVYIPFKYAIELPSDAVTTFVVHAAFDGEADAKHAFEITGPEDLEFESDTEVKGLFPARGNTFTLSSLSGLCDIGCDPTISVQVYNSLESTTVHLGETVIPLEIVMTASACKDIEVTYQSFAFTHLPDQIVDMSHFCRGSSCDKNEDWAFQSGLVRDQGTGATLMGPTGRPGLITTFDVEYYFWDSFIVRAGTTKIVNFVFTIADTEVVPLIGESYEVKPAIFEYGNAIVDTESGHMETAQFTIAAGS